MERMCESWASSIVLMGLDRSLTDEQFAQGALQDSRSLLLYSLKGRLGQTRAKRVFQPLRSAVTLRSLVMCSREAEILERNEQLVVIQIVLVILAAAAACSPLQANPPSKSTAKAQVLCEQRARVLQQTTKYALYCKATDNVDSSIKFQKFLQRFAVFST